MSYCIMRVEKRKRKALYGLQIEANRTTADHAKGRDFAASDIQWCLTDFNMFLVKSENWNRAVTAAFKDAEIQERKNSVVVLDGFYGASPEWFRLPFFPRADLRKGNQCCNSFRRSNAPSDLPIIAAYRGRGRAYSFVCP